MKSLLQTLLGLLIGLIMAAGMLLLLGRPRGEPVRLPPVPTQSSLVVYVSGEVARPGLYSFPPGSRVAEALVAAGGTLPGADLGQINQAQLLSDGYEVRVPGKDQTAASTRSSDPPPALEMVDINLASPAQLETLPGIGPEKAAQIVADRLEHGDFQTIEDIQRVPGIGPVLFEKIKDWIFVTP